MTKSQATLDDPATLAFDRSDMLRIVAGLGRQLSDGYAAGRSLAGLPAPEGVRAVVVCGMGGSGVVGDVVHSLFAARIPIPLLVVKGYALPEFCGRDTLVLAVSFSGDTEETLAVYAQAVAAGCRVVAISMGGELAALAKADEVPRVPVPDSIPMPRAALGFLSGAAMGVLEAIGLLPPFEADVGEAERVLGSLAADLGAQAPAERNEAKSLAAWLAGRMPVVWGTEGLAAAAALRWKTQMNENAKAPAFHATLPELDHNEIEGWTSGSGGAFALVVLRHRGEHPRVAERVRATLEAMSGSGLEAREVHAEGHSPLESLFSLVMKGDFTSTYLAMLRGVDPTPVPALSGLKERLSR